MMRTLGSRRWFPLVVVAAYAAGCGLISSDITRLTFDLPTKSYVFSTASAQLPTTGTLPQVACATDADCCALPGINCATTQLACMSGQCAIEQPVTVSQTMNLGQEVSQLHGAQSLADIFISEISYTVASTLNTALPPIVLYLAPNGVVDPKDPSAKKFGTVPMTTAAENASGTVQLESDSQETFSGYAQHLDTPFNFIATTTVVVAGGAPIPNGQVTISVTGKVSVQAKL